MDEVGEINDYIQEQAGQTAEIILGLGHDPGLGDKVSVTVIATGFKTGEQKQAEVRKPDVIVYKSEAGIARLRESSRAGSLMRLSRCRACNR